MKHTRNSKTVSLILAAVLLLGVVFSFGTSAVGADAITATESITSVNVEHRDLMHLAFQVSKNATHSGVLGIMVWEAGVTDYTAETAIFSNFETSTDSEGTVYYAAQAVAAKDIVTEYQVAVVEKSAAGDITVISVPAAYSIAGWAQTKLADPETTDPVRINLYNKVIAYGKVASSAK